MDGAWGHVHSISWRFILKVNNRADIIIKMLIYTFLSSCLQNAQMSYCSTYCVLNYECNWCFRFKLIQKNCFKVRSSWEAKLEGTGKLITILYRSIIYYFTTTVCAVILGIILVTTIRPGSGQNSTKQGGQKVTRDVLTADTLLDLIR